MHHTRTGLAGSCIVLRCNVVLYPTVEGHGMVPSMIMGNDSMFTLFRQVGYTVEYCFLSFFDLRIIWLS